VTGSAWLAFTPRDTVFVRDGRSFDAQTDSTAATVRPGPTTIAGASGAVFGQNPAAVRGPVLARLIGGEWDAYFPAPADLIQTSDSPRPQVHRLELAEIGGQTDLDAALPGAGLPGRERPARWLVPPQDAESAEPVTGLVPAGTLRAYLAGTLPAAGGTPLARLNAEDDPFKPERRVGLARDADRRARTGFLYQMTHLRSEDGWAFLAECAFSSDQVPSVPAGPVQFGGRGRLADVSEVPLTWPPAPDIDQREAAEGRVLVYLATPALWPDGWRIPVPEGVRLVAAACGKPVPAATLTPGPRWKQTRVLRWAVPAGSVYLLEFDDPAAGAKWAAGVHGTAYGPIEGDLGYMRTAGFGVVLTGVW
jgi:CRISPR type III-B/RAMP module-associated protein Cmr3